MTLVMLKAGAAGEALAPQDPVPDLTLVVLLPVWLSGAGWLVGRLGRIGVTVVTRVSGIVTAALAVQFVVDGVRDLVT